jgi:hypothetical protein
MQPVRKPLKPQLRQLNPNGDRVRQREVLLGRKYKWKAIGMAGVTALMGALAIGQIKHAAVEMRRLDAEAKQEQKINQQKKAEFDRGSQEIRDKYKLELLQWKLLQEMRQRNEETNQKQLRERNFKKQQGGPGRRNIIPLRKYEDPVAQEAMYEKVHFPAKHISAQYIDAELKGIRSPFAGKSVKIIELAKKYNVDPGFFLSVAIEESHAGTKGLGAKNRNPTNIRWTSQARFPKGVGGFIQYPTWEAGIAGFFSDLAKGSNYYRSGRESVRSIIAVRSPSTENSTNRMVAQISQRMDKYKREGIN